jgi:hypothetical protein
MNKDLSAYSRVQKYCEVCRKVTTHIVEPSVSVCLGCDTFYEDDAEDLFGPVDEFIE